MPELPEVQTTVNGLNQKVIQRTILGVFSDIPHKIHCYDRGRDRGFEGFKGAVQGQRILAARRWAKNIIIDLTGGWSLQIHQKMTGHLLYGRWQLVNGFWVAEGRDLIAQDPMNRFIHLLFVLDDGWHLALSDSRKFAKIALWPTREMELSPEFQQYGPDALDLGLTWAGFSKQLMARKGRIKTILMDQRVIAGIGNIYADEILFKVGIQPQSLVQKLTLTDTKNIFTAMRRILKEAVRLGGTSSSDYRNINGAKGGYAAKLQVYRRQHQPCLSCGAEIQRTKLGSRSAHFCPRCQKVR